MRPTHVSVLIPACNEEELLPPCLESIKEAITHLRGEENCEVTCDIVVVVDRSTDRTWDIAVSKIGSTHGVVVCSEAGVVGEARALAAELALRRYAGSLNRCWLANTDADCVVPSNWLSEQLDLAATGVDVIAGTIDVVDFREHDSMVEERFRRTYPIAPDGSHLHVHGANLGVRADVYCQAGGWKSLLTGEDHDLWQRLARVNARRISVNRTRIVTSGRRVGRAPHGFAEALAAHNENAA